MFQIAKGVRAEHEICVFVQFENMFLALSASYSQSQACPDVTISKHYIQLETMPWIDMLTPWIGASLIHARVCTNATRKLL